MIEHISREDPRIDEIIELVKGRTFVHANPKNVSEFRSAVHRMVCEIVGAIDQRNPDTLYELIETNEEQIVPHSSPGDPDSPEEQKYH